MAEIKLYQEICSALPEFQEEYEEELKNLKRQFTASLGILKKQVSECGKRQKVGYVSKGVELSVTKEEKNLNIEGLSSRGRRRVPVKIFEVPKRVSKRTKKTVKRKSSSSPSEEPVPKTVRKEELANGESPRREKHFLPQCTVVLKKISNISHYIEEVEPDAQNGEIEIEDAASEKQTKSISNSTVVSKKLQSSGISQNDKSHQINGKKEEVKDDKNEIQAQNVGVVKSAFCDIINSTGKKNFSKRLNDSEVIESMKQKSILTTDKKQSHNVTSVENSSSASQTLKCNYNLPPEELESISIVDGTNVGKDTEHHSDTLKRIGKKLPGPSDEENLTSLHTQSLSAKQPSTSNCSNLDDPPAKVPRDEQTPSDQTYIMIQNGAPATLKRVTRSKMAKKDDKLGAADPSQITQSNDIPASQKSTTGSNIPKNDTAANGRSEENYSSPEKRIERSKVSPPTADKDIHPRVDEIKSTPEKRITRSKMAQPKENKEVPLRPQNENKIAANTAESQGTRITRSKMAKVKEKTTVIIDSSSDEESPESEVTSPIPQPKTKMQAITMEFFSPAVTNYFFEKENPVRLVRTDEKKISKTTPLQSRNALATPIGKYKLAAPNIITSATKSKKFLQEVEKRKKEEEAKRKRLKEEEAIRKKNEMLKAKQEDVKRKNEEKQQKVAAIREAANKETTERLAKMEKEKEERERLAKEHLEKKKEEEAVKKKKVHEAKALEAEARRLKEEAARQARIKEIEEEERMEEALRLKQQQETERIKKMRQEEMRMKEAALKAREAQKKKANLIPLKDKDNYDISDVTPNDGDSDVEDDPSRPKKEIPAWAKKGGEKGKNEKIQSFVSMEVAGKYFACPSQTPDLSEFFGKLTMKRVRTSSAVWLDTPPLKSKS